MRSKGFVMTLEAFSVLLLVLGLSFSFSFQSFDEKKVFYRRLLAEDFAEVSMKSKYFGMVRNFDSAGLKSFYATAGKAVGVKCVKFGFSSLSQAGCLNETQFFQASRSVFADGEWKQYRLVLGFD